MSQRKKTTKKPAKLLDYTKLLGQVKERIRHAQVRAVLSVNAELIRLYWDIGRMLEERQGKEGYGTAVIPRLARDLRNELPEVKGFSERNIGRMIAFFRAYPRPAELLPQAVAKVAGNEVSPQPVAKLKATEKVLLLVAPTRFTSGSVNRATSFLSLRIDMLKFLAKKRSPYCGSFDARSLAVRALVLQRSNNSIDSVLANLSWSILS